MSSEKTLGITISGDISDILAKLDEVIGKIQDVPDRTVELGLNVNDTGLDSLKTDMDGISDKSIAVNVDDSGLSQLAIAADDASNSVQAIGDSATYASSDINSSLGAASPAESSLISLSSNANTASNEITETGTSAVEAGNEIAGSMGDAVLTIAAVGAAAELAAQQIYGMSQDIEQLSNYTGLTTDELKRMETSLSSASFPISDIDSYLTALSQLGVSADLLEKNAYAMNEIAEGTGASSSAVSQFAKDIKALGGDVSNLSEYYGLAGYAQANVVGGLEGFASYAKTLGPKLTEMGLSAEESTVVIGALSQKYAGNMRGMRSAVTAADGDVNKLYSSLGLTQSSVDSSVGSFDSYSSKLTDTADSARDAHSDLEEVYVSAQDLGIMLGFTGGDVLSFTGILAAAAVGPYLFTKALDKLGLTANWSGKYIQFLKNGVGTVGDFFKSAGESILNTIKSWMGWGDEAGKASENVAQKMLEKTAGVGDVGETVGRAAGEGFSKGVSESATLIDEAGNVIWRDTDDVIGRVSSQSVKAEEVGSLIPEGISKGILKGAPKIASRLADVLLIVTLGLDQLYNAQDYYEQGVGTNFIELYGFDLYKGVPVVGGAIQYAEDKINSFYSFLGMGSAKQAWSNLFGPDVANQAGDFFGRIQGAARTTWDELSHGNFRTFTQPFTDGFTYLSTYDYGAALANAPAAFDNATNQIAYNAGLTLGTLYKFPGRAYTALLPTGQNMYNALINAPAYLQGAWGNTAIWFTNLPGTLYGYGANAWNGLTNGFNSTYANVAGAVNNVPNTINDTVTWIGGLPGTLYEYGANSWNGLTNGFNSSLGNVQAAGGNLVATVQGGIQWIIDLPGNMYLWGQNIINEFTRGLGDALGGAKSWIEAKLGWLFRGFESASPPKEGPLKTIDLWGESIGGTFTDGVISGLSSSKSLVSSALEDIGFNNMVTSTALPSATSIYNRTGGISVQFTGDIKVPEGSDPLAVGRDLGQGVVEGMNAAKLQGQASNAGIHVINSRR